MSFSEEILRNPLEIKAIKSEMEEFSKFYGKGKPNSVVNDANQTIIYNKDGNPFVRTVLSEDERTFQGFDNGGLYYNISAINIGNSEISYAGDLVDLNRNLVEKVVGDEKQDPVEGAFDDMKMIIEANRAQGD